MPRLVQQCTNQRARPDGPKHLAGRADPYSLRPPEPASHHRDDRRRDERSDDEGVEQEADAYRRGAVPPARAAAVPLVVLHDQFAMRRRDARAGYSRADSTKRRSTEDTHDRAVRRKALGDGC